MISLTHSYILHFMRYVASFFMVLFFLNACQISSEQKAGDFYITQNLKTGLIPLSKFEGEVIISNLMESRYKNASYTTASLIKISEQEMKVIALSDISRLFTISYQNGNIRAEFSDLIPLKEAAPLYILSDIQLIYFPFPAIKSSLPAEMQLTQTQNNDGLLREFYYHNQKIISISYSTSNIYTAEIEFKNLERDYSYKIRNNGEKT